MPRTATTNTARVTRTGDRADLMTDALSAALAHGDPDIRSDDDVCSCPLGHADGLTERECATDAWTRVASLAGNIQRDARMLAGLGRGG